MKLFYLLYIIIIYKYIEKILDFNIKDFKKILYLDLSLF